MHDDTIGTPDGGSAEVQLLQAIALTTVQTRNSVRFIAWVIAISVVLSLIVGFVVGAQIAKVSGSLNTGSPSSTCLSLGGTDPSC